MNKVPKKIWILTIALVINVTGTSFLWPLNTIYVHHELGKSLAFAGAILLFSNAASITGNLIGGVLFDKYSPYKTVIYSTLLATAAAICLALYHDVTAYTILLVISGFGTGITWPVIFAMAGSIWPEGGRRAFNTLYVGQNLGVAIGATIGGFIASLSFDYIFMANALVFVIFFLFVLVTFKDMDQEHDRQMHTTVLQQRKDIKNRQSFIALLILCSGFFVTWVAYSQWQATISSHTQYLGIPLEQYSMLWAINGFLIVLGQPIIRLITNRVTSQKMHIYIGNSILLVSFMIVMFAEQFTVFAIAMVILTFGEMLFWPAVPSLANELAPKGRTGFYQGIVNSVGAAARMVGPVLGGLVVDLYDIQVLFYILLGLLLLPYMTTTLFDRGLKKDMLIEQETQ